MKNIIPAVAIVASQLFATGVNATTASGFMISSGIRASCNKQIDNILQQGQGTLSKLCVKWMGGNEDHIKSRFRGVNAVVADYSSTEYQVNLNPRKQ